MPSVWPLRRVKDSLRRPAIRRASLTRLRGLPPLNYLTFDSRSEMRGEIRIDPRRSLPGLLPSTPKCNGEAQSGQRHGIRLWFGDSSNGDVPPRRIIAPIIISDVRLRSHLVFFSRHYPHLHSISSSVCVMVRNCVKPASLVVLERKVVRQAIKGCDST